MKYLIAIVAVLALIGFMPNVGAQSVILPPTVEGVGTAINADDTDLAMVCKFVGPSTGMTTTMNSGKVEVTVTTSDITFTSGAAGAEAADTTLECPVSGAFGGIIDVSNAACNTLGEVLDIVNVPSSNFRCVAIDAFRADVLDGRLLTKAATTANSVNGLGIQWDTSTAFDMSAALVPSEYRTMRPYLPSGQARTLKHDVWNNARTIALLANAVSTYTSGTSTLRLYSVDVVDVSPATGKTADTVTEMYSEAGGATTAAKIFDLGSPIGVMGRKNEKLLVRLDNSAVMNTAQLKAFGYLQRLGPP